MTNRRNARRERAVVRRLKDIQSYEVQLEKARGLPDTPNNRKRKDRVLWKLETAVRDVEGTRANIR